MIIKLLALCVLFQSAMLSNAQQQYTIVINDGHVIDPKNNINEVMDVAISDGKIARVAREIDTSGATQVIDARNTIVVPGLIDIHGHVYYGTDPDRYLSNGISAISPDGFTFRTGVTTIVDAGGAGHKNFSLFKELVIDHSKTRVLAFLNIVGEGMRGGRYEQDTSDMSSEKAAAIAKQFNEYIVGFKVAHYFSPHWTPVERAVNAGNQTGLPVMIDFGSSAPPLPLQELFAKHLRPGDIYTHTFAQLKNREAIVDIHLKKIKPFAIEAQHRGIIFDVGFGGLSFTFSQAIPAIRQQFFPNTLSTDIHSASMNHAMKDILNVMSIFHQLGMDVPAIIKSVTWAPALAIKRETLGNLSPGSVADIAILNIRKGSFAFFDHTGYKVKSNKRFECELTIREGNVVYDLNGRADPVFIK
jgi:dihydroorotase